MKTKVIFMLFFILVFFSKVCGQENIYADSLDCPFYYDTILQKKVYKIVYPFPAYDDSTNMHMFGFVLIGEMKKDGFKFRFEPEEPVFRTSVPLYFVINEDGFMENIYIRGKTEEEYTRLDKGVIKTLNRLKTHQWEPGRCNGTKVPVLVPVPMHLDFRRYN